MDHKWQPLWPHVAVVLLSCNLDPIRFTVGSLIVVKHMLRSDKMAVIGEPICALAREVEAQ